MTRKRRTFGSTSEHYIDNDKFYQEMCKFKDECNKIEKEWNKKHLKDLKKIMSEQGISEKKAKLQLPEIPWPTPNDYIGKCFYSISYRLSGSGNFYGYTFKEEMIGDGIENCLQVIKSFMPEKSTNPFSYFTQVCWYAFVRRIKKEQKQQDIKKSMIMNSSLIPELEASTIPGDNTQYELGYVNYMMGHIDQRNADDQDFEKKHKPLPKRLTKHHQALLKEKEKAEELEKKRDQAIARKAKNDLKKEKLYNGELTEIDEYYEEISKEEYE